MKRDNYITWDQCYMGLAQLVAMRSKDPKRQVGAVIVDNNHIVLSTGYNGFPWGISDDVFPWDTNPDDIAQDKHTFVCHAELNAILNSKETNLQDTTIYVTLFPCVNCAKAIIQKGIKKVIYLIDKDNGTKENLITKNMFDTVGVIYEQYNVTGETIITT